VLIQLYWTLKLKLKLLFKSYWTWNLKLKFNGVVRGCGGAPSQAALPRGAAYLGFRGGISGFRGFIFGLRGFILGFKGGIFLFQGRHFKIWGAALKAAYTLWLVRSRCSIKRPEGKNEKVVWQRKRKRRHLDPPRAALCHATPLVRLLCFIQRGSLSINYNNNFQILIGSNLSYGI